MGKPLRAGILELLVKDHAGFAAKLMPVHAASSISSYVKLLLRALFGFILGYRDDPEH
jgi:hypothetical protein